MGTLQIVHFKVLVFSYPWGDRFLDKSPVFGEAMHLTGFRTLFWFFVAELQRAKRVSEAPWVRKIGNPSS